MTSELNGQRIAFLVAQEGVEEVELTEPWEAVEKAGGSPELVAPESGEVQAFNHLDKGSTFPVDETLADARPGEYDGVVLPGGVANPDQLRTTSGAIELPAGVLRRRQARGRDLPRAMDARGGRSGARPQVDLVAIAADRHPQCGR